jgi:hypothetical protein
MISDGTVEQKQKTLQRAAIIFVIVTLERGVKQKQNDNLYTQATL